MRYVTDAEGLYSNMRHKFCDKCEAKFSFYEDPLCQECPVSEMLRMIRETKMRKYYREWREVEDKTVCSGCGGEGTKDMKFCPHCGSDMSGERMSDWEKWHKRRKMYAKCL